MLEDEQKVIEEPVDQQTLIINWDNHIRVRETGACKLQLIFAEKEEKQFGTKKT